MLMKSCKRGHTSLRYADGHCIECVRIRPRSKTSKEKVRNQQYNHIRKFPFGCCLKAAKSRAKKRNIEYALNWEWAKTQWTGKCSLTGIEFHIRNGQEKCGPKFYSPSIDRINPKLGYIPTNCRFILAGINAFKLSATDEDVIMVCRAILKNRVA